MLLLMIKLITLLLLSLNINAQDCEVLNPVDTTGATVLGNGTAGSVTTAAIQSALDAGGMIRFNQGINTVNHQHYK
jgi:NADPH:quinone reductase-like Zn-dependent oxidoreductase